MNVLLIHTNRNVSATIELSLKHFFGYNVFVINLESDVSEFYQQKSKEIDLIIMDDDFKLSSCEDVFDAIKEINPHQKIIVISAYGRREFIDELMKRGLDDFLSVPFRIHELKESISKIMKK